MKRICRQVYHKHRQLIIYIIMGGLTTVVSLILFYVSTWAFFNSKDALQLQAANIFSWTGSVMFAYIGNRMFVFHSTSRHVIKEMISFALSRVSTLLLDMAVMFAGVTVCGFRSDLVKWVSILLVTVVNYMLSRFYVFRHMS